MHIAICDDNVADRKQLERLLKRESDKRAQTSGIVFADSFGSSQVMLANPMQYDAFYIDICRTEGITGGQVVRNLIAQGVNAPIILCCSDINYREETYPENVLFLDKPIQVAELSLSLNHAERIAGQKEPLIELRQEKETIYVREPDILYGVEEGPSVRVSLTDGRILQVADTALNLFNQLESHPTFMAPSSKTLINARYIQKIGFYKVTMTDGKQFRMHRDCIPYAKQIYAELHAE